MGLLDSLLLSPLLLSLSPPSTAPDSPTLTASSLAAWLAAVLAGGSHATISSNSGSDGSNSKIAGSLAVVNKSNGGWQSQQERAAAAHAAEAVSVRIKALPDGEREALLVKVRGS